MGDYTKLIVDATVKAPKADIETAVAKLSLYYSAYHCAGVVEKIVESPFDKNVYCVTLVGQTKWGDRQNEFLDWISPFVIQGSGERDCWSMQFSEYQIEPTCRFRFMKG